MQDHTDRDPHAPERDGQLPEPASPVSSAPTSSEPADSALANPGGTSPTSPWAPRGGPWSDQHLAPNAETAAEPPDPTGWPGQESYHGQHSSPPATDSAAADSYAPDPAPDSYAPGSPSPFGQPPATEPAADGQSPYEPAAHADPAQPNGWPSWPQAGWPDQPQQIDPAGAGTSEVEDDDFHHQTTQFSMLPDAKPAETDEAVRGVAHVPSPAEAAEAAESENESPDEPAAEQEPAAAEQSGWPQGQWPSYQQAEQHPDQPQWQPSWPPEQGAIPAAAEPEAAQPGIDPHPDLPPAYVPTEFASGHFQDGQFYPGHFQPGQQQPAYGQNAQQQPTQPQSAQQQPDQQAQPAQPAEQAGWGQPATPPNWGQPAGTTYGQPAEQQQPQQPQPYDPQAGYAQYNQEHQYNQGNQQAQYNQYNQPGYEQQGYPQQEQQQQQPAPQQYPYQLGQPQQPNAGPAGTPTAADFAARRAHRPEAPKATVGLQGLVRRASFGLVKPPPGRREVESRNAIGMVRRNFGGLRQVTVVNPKGGAGKTVAVLMVAMTFGQQRGGYVLSWDNNETQGTLGMRAQQDFHARTVRDLLGELSSFTGPTGRVGDLSKFVRSQGEAMFDVLASDESATAGEMLTAQAFGQIRNVVSRFYKLIIVDTGNNVRAANWQASIEATDQLVVPMSARGDSAETASRMLDHLDQNGRHDLVRRAVSVISMPASTKGVDLPAIRAHFAARTRAVLTAPYEPLLDSGEPIRYEELSQRSRLAWLRIAAAIAEGL